MTVDEFQDHVNNIINSLGEEAIVFLTVIKKMEEYFLKADEDFYGTPLLLEEFAEIGHNVLDVLGNEDGKRFFNAIWDTLPTQTIMYLCLLVKLFELGNDGKNPLTFPVL